MKSVCTQIVLVVVVMAATLTAICQQKNAGTNAPKPSPAAQKPATMQGNPFYENWSHFKPGTETDYQLSVDNDGVVTQLPLHYVLVEVTAEHVVLELNFPAGTRVTVHANKADGMVDGWPMLLYQFPYLPMVKVFTGQKNVEASGRTFDCKFGNDDSPEMKMKQWFSGDVPGGLVKADVVAQGAKMQLILTGIKTPD